MLIAQRGFSLIELAIGIAIVGILMAAAMPQFTQMLQNAQVKSATESTITGLNLARAEALRRNMPVSFHLVNNLTNACILDSTSTSWVVSLASPVGLCATAPTDSGNAAMPTGADPIITQKFSGQESGRNATVVAVLADFVTPSTTATFNGLGRVTGNSIAAIDVKNSTNVCQHDVPPGTMRCLRIRISTGGQARVCDPSPLVAPTDPRYCF